MWLGRTIWPKEGGLPFNKQRCIEANKMDHLYELRDLIQTNNQHIRAVVVDRRPTHNHHHDGSAGTPAVANNHRLYSMLRVLKDGTAQGEEWIKCLREAVQVHYRIDHPHVVSLHQVYEDEEELCVVTDHLRGTRLYDEMLRRGRFKEAEVIPLVQQLLYIATCLESNGVGLAVRPDTVFVETTADGDGASARCSLSLPDLFLIIAQNMAKERNVTHENFGFGDMSPPLGYSAPEVVLMDRWRREGRCCTATADLSAPIISSSSSDPAASSDEPTSDSTASASASPSTAACWASLDPYKTDVWQIGIIAFLLLSGGGASHPSFSSFFADIGDADGRRHRWQHHQHYDGNNAAEDAMMTMTTMMTLDVDESAASAAAAPRRGCTSPRLAFTGECWSDVSESAKCFLQSLLASDPTKRPTARQALRHPWLCGGAVMMLEDICIEAIVDNVDVLPDYAERLPKFLVKKITTNTINYRGALPPHRRRVCGVGSSGSVDTTSTETDAVTSAVPADPPSDPQSDSSSAAPKPFGLADLVAELILNILSFLPHKDLLCLGQVCHQLYELSSDNFLWKRLCTDEVDEHDEHHHDSDQQQQSFVMSEEQVKQITYDNIEASMSSSSCGSLMMMSSASSPLFRSASALKRRRKNKKKAKEKPGRHSDYALLASMDRYLWKNFYFFGLPCRWSSSRKHETIEFANGHPSSAKKALPECWCTVLGSKAMKKGIHSWTIEITHGTDQLGDIMIGVCKASVDPTKPSYLSDKAWLYHINQCNLYHRGTSMELHKMTTRGVGVRYVTCTLNLGEGTLAISINDQDLGVIASNLVMKEGGGGETEFYAAVDLFNAGDTVTLRSFSSVFSPPPGTGGRRNSGRVKDKDRDRDRERDKEAGSAHSHEVVRKERLDMSVSGSLTGDNGLQSVRVTKKFWNSRKTVYFTCSLTQTLFHPGSPIDLAVSIDNRSAKTIRCLIISFRGVKGKKAIPMGYSHTSFSSTEGTISFPIEGRRKEEGTFAFRLPSHTKDTSTLVDSYELHLELPIRGHSSLKAVLPLRNIQGYRSSSSSSSSASPASSSTTNLSTNTNTNGATGNSSAGT